MKLDVDRERPFNRLPARPQSSANQDEIRKQLSKRLDLGVIAPSRSTNWSHVLLAAKSNGAKRLCIDLRALNKALQDQVWQTFKKEEGAGSCKHIHHEDGGNKR
jgi:hypothetical protein